MLELKLIKFCDLDKYLTCQFMHQFNSCNVQKSFINFTFNNTLRDYTRVWVKASTYQKWEMIMENEVYRAMIVCNGTKLYFKMSISAAH